MLRDIFQSRIFIGALVFFVLSVVGGTLYIGFVEQQGSDGECISVPVKSVPAKSVEQQGSQERHRKAEISTDENPVAYQVALEKRRQEERQQKNADNRAILEFYKSDRAWHRKFQALMKESELLNAEGDRLGKAAATERRVELRDKREVLQSEKPIYPIEAMRRRGRGIRQPILRR